MLDMYDFVTLTLGRESVYILNRVHTFVTRFPFGRNCREHIKVTQWRRAHLVHPHGGRDVT